MRAGEYLVCEAAPQFWAVSGFGPASSPHSNEIPESYDRFKAFAHILHLLCLGWASVPSPEFGVRGR